MEHHYFECMCTSDEHRVIVTIDREEKELNFHYFLANKVWYKRVRLAIKYVFGYKCLYGHFGETILDEKNILKLKNLCEKALEEKQNEH